MNQSEQPLREVAALSPEDALRWLASRPPGLTPTEVDTRTRQYGLNRVATKRPRGAGSSRTSSSIPRFNLLAFGVLWYVFRANIAARQSFFLSGWFVVGLLTQTLVVQMIRTRQAPFTQSRASYPVLATTGAVIFAGMLIPFSLVERQLGKVTLPPGFMGFAGLWALAYAATMQLVKRWYIARYHEWL